MKCNLDGSGYNFPLKSLFSNLIQDEDRRTSDHDQALNDIKLKD